MFEGLLPPKRPLSDKNCPKLHIFLCYYLSPLFILLLYLLRDLQKSGILCLVLERRRRFQAKDLQPLTRMKTQFLSFSFTLRLLNLRLWHSFGK
jgi:hypothetical protein